MQASEREAKEVSEIPSGKVLWAGLECAATSLEMGRFEVPSGQIHAIFENYAPQASRHAAMAGTPSKGGSRRRAVQ